MSAERPLWRCLKCRRVFANTNQSHACATHDLDSHFSARPAHIRALYDALLAAIETNGPVIIIPEKTRIAFQVRMSFAVAMPRNAWLDGHLVLARRAEHPRWRTIQVISPRNIVHAFRLREIDEIDSAFRSLLSEAYAVGEQKHLGRGKATDAG